MRNKEQIKSLTEEEFEIIREYKSLSGFIWENICGEEFISEVPKTLRKRYFMKPGQSSIGLAWQVLEKYFKEKK